MHVPRYLDKTNPWIDTISDRRSLLKAVLGVQGMVLIGTAFRQNADAARRGTSGPEFPAGSGTGGYTFEIRANRENLFSVVALPGRGPTDFSATFLNRTSYELKIEIFVHDALFEMFQLSGNDNLYVLFQEAGLYQFRIVRGEISSEMWEFRIPG